MASIRGQKRSSEDALLDNEDATITQQKVPTKTDSPSMVEGGSPSKRRKVGITMAQKQALIQNLQIEIAERARRLRQQYNVQAQSLRARVELRVNRIPTALRNVKMGEIVEALKTRQQPKPLAALVSSSVLNKPPPVPEKDAQPARPISQRSAAATVPASHSATARSRKRPSEEMVGDDKENDVGPEGGAKKRVRAQADPRRASKVLSPTSANTKIMPRPAPSPAKSFIARPISPVKTTGVGNAVSNLVSKARATRGTAPNRTTSASTTTTSSTSTASAPARRGRKPAAGLITKVAAAPAQNTAARVARRASGISETSDGSTSTVIKKTVSRTAATKASAAKAAATSKTKAMMSAVKGVTGGTRRAPAKTVAAAAPTASVATGRVLRKRG